ncbi:MAG: response regulator [Treponema sp.]|jgi:signal transduction histidine kinase|nr:response regulator [Treponema sp.]
MGEEVKFDSEAEELVFLRKEVKRLTRQLEFSQRTLDRLKTTTMAQEGVESVFKNESLKRDHYMQLILKHNPDVLILFDEKPSVLYCSEVFLKNIGVEQFGQIAGRSFHEVFSRFVPEAKLETMRAAFHESIEISQPIMLEETLELGSVGKRHLEIHFTPMVDKQGKYEGALMIFHDTTDIQHAIKRAEEASKAKSSFLANMSHEIRTPLNAVIGMANIGHPAADIEKKNYCFEKIKGASTHLLGVINDILDMSKIEADKFELSFTKFDFSRMLRRVTDVIGFKIDEKRQRLNLSLDPAIPRYILSDEQRLAQVITNLLSNAVKFTPEGGTIAVAAERLQAEGAACILKISVTDTGIGITPEQKEKLFHSFEQADNSISRKFGGTGLGLAISKRIVEMLDGTIVVESELGKGSTFSFTIKAEIAAAASEPEPDSVHGGDAAAGDTESLDGRFAGCRILLAEDVDINREIVKTVFEPTGACIHEAENGKIAFEKFAAAPGDYDLILMDIQMPGMGGYEATRLIRAMEIEKAQRIPIIAMTANVFSEDIENCLAAGMNSHIGKPLDFDVLFKIIGQYLPVR